MKLRKIISNIIRENLNEQINKKTNLDISNVLKYLNPTADEKQEYIREQWDDLVSRFSNLIPYFCEQNNISCECEDDDCIDFIYENDYENLFEEWLIKNFENFNFEDFDIPSWYYFKNPKIVKGTFVHFTNNSNEIVNNGFTKGIDDISILGMTTLLGDEYKKRGGLNFAYYIKDLNSIRKDRYGKECVMFDGIGIRAYHKIDKEYEVIFNPKDISNIRKCGLEK
jgi:hypothetical protein